MEHQHFQDIVGRMIQVEFEAMHFYRKAAACLQDEEASFHFDLLAAEELEHARSFYDLATEKRLPAFEKMAEICPEKTLNIDVDCQQLASFNQIQALELALRLEQEIELELLELVDKIADEDARKIIARNIKSTHGHIMLIGEDLDRLYEENCAGI